MRFRDPWGHPYPDREWFAGLLTLVFAPVWMLALSIVLVFRWLGGLGNWLGDRAEWVWKR